MNTIMNIIISISIGVSILIIGIVTNFFYPKEINPLSGYRTTLSSKNQDTWNEAQSYSAKVLIVLGLISTFMSLVISLLFANYLSMLICVALSVVICILVIPITEKHLQNTFDNNGKRRLK